MLLGFQVPKQLCEEQFPRKFNRSNRFRCDRRTLVPFVNQLWFRMGLLEKGVLVGVHLGGGLHRKKLHQCRQQTWISLIHVWSTVSCSWEALSDIWIGVLLAKPWSKALTIDCQGGDLQPHQKLASEKDLHATNNRQLHVTRWQKQANQSLTLADCELICREPSIFKESPRGNTIRGNRTESLWEGNLPLIGSLRGPLKKIWSPQKKKWKPQKTAENL